MRHWLDENRIERSELTKQRMRMEILALKRKALRLESFLLKIPDTWYSDDPEKNRIAKNLINREMEDVLEFWQKDEKEIYEYYCREERELEKKQQARKPNK